MSYKVGPKLGLQEALVRIAFDAMDRSRPPSVLLASIGELATEALAGSAAEATPGPWEFCSQKDGPVIDYFINRYWIDEAGTTRRDTICHSIAKMADGVMMAAAPDMVAVLEETIAPLLAHPHEEHNMSPASWAWFCRVRAALGKAKGETP
jgi:hypothetical protein